ncbi:unnamed protein product [Danaus chrysippus]|uniref:(African queen) hypothetical protein n=1 Tax=Danaus chrysippus TaxID=151541 RepID=A0A8J2WEN7_9NEOP|nr:unnamed protein product [Danaus chrysippus]
MADCSESLKKTKCRSSKKGPQLKSWIWCFLIKCLISLPCIFSKCLGVDITVAIYPPGEIIVEYGKPLELFCVAENYSANDIKFLIGGQTLESEVVNSSTRRLYIKKPEKQASTYYCQNTKNQKKCTSRVLVESPPTDVTDFSCISYNLEILNCSWTSLVTLTSMNYSVTFSGNNYLATPPCFSDKVYSVMNRKRYCLWNTTSQPRYRQQEEKQYFYLTACNVYACNSQNFTIDHYSIVKPDPPSNLQVTENGTHSVQLMWSIPNNMADLLPCGVDHIIEYQIAKIDNTTHFRRVNASFLPPKNKIYRFQLTDLPYAHKQYEVRVFIKSKKATKRELWSDFSYVVFYTASERPKRPPDTVAGAFHKSAYSNNRVIYVYWKQLEEYEEAGANFTYKIIVSQDNKTQTVFPDKNKSLSYVRLNATLNALDITVWSLNNKGTSLNSSHLYIPAEKDTHSLKLTSFTKLAYENGTYELSWVAIKNIDNYTLFWCQHNATQICVGRMDFAVLSPNKSNHVIDLPREYRYQFAISANNGSKTSGMVWANCDISKDGFVMYGFPVHLKYDAPGKSHVTLRWLMDCALQDGIITGYNISYCPIVQTSSYCDKSFNNSYKFISNPKQMQVTIENLFPFRTYQFTIALNTIYGQKTIENATAVITTSEDTPTNPVNISVSNIRNTSLVISWDPPIHKNGNIGKYVIYNYDKELYVDSVSGTDTSRRQVTITGLQGFTKYSLTVQACNIPIGLCSKIRSNDSVNVTTRIGAPSRLRAPTVKNSPNKLQWEPPEIPGGRVDLYEIRRIKDDLAPEIINTTELSYPLEYCVGVVSTEMYQVRAVNFDVTPSRKGINEPPKVYVGPWSESSVVACRTRDGLTMILIIMAVLSLTAIVVYGSIKQYKKYRKMEDIKPVLPSGLGIPEKDISKYTFGNWNPTTKEEKPSSDEMLLLPNSKTTVSSTDTKQKDDNCASSDHTDSTALSESSRGPVERQASTSEEGSETSEHLEVVADKGDNSAEIQEEESSASDTETSPENSPYFSDKAFKKNPTSGYVQPVVSTTSGYVQSAPAPVQTKCPSQSTATQPASNSYVMAGLPPPVFVPNSVTATNPPTLSSGYVLPEDVQARSMMNTNKFGPSIPKSVGPESLPTMPSLPPAAKQSADNSYIQLQSLDSLPSLKLSERNSFPKQPSSGYVSPADVVINKHLNILTGGQHAEESAILDPTMSPDAYCRFSWSNDPANDNLNTLLSDSPTRTYNN